MVARKDRGLTQGELASAMEVDRTVITKIETGQRMVDSLELARLGEILRRPIGWFVTDPPPSVVSRREQREVLVRREDIQLESLAQDVEQLIELGVLQPPAAMSASIDSIAAAEQVAFAARRQVGLTEDEPVWNLVRVAEKLGLYAFVLELDEREGSQADGSYLALEGCGVALINRASEDGRRRFTIAHELGHHVLNDEYAPEWIVGTDSTEGEKRVNAFAIHFLMPCPAIRSRWQRLKGAADPRNAAIHLAVEFGVSWSAACNQLHRAGCLSGSQRDDLLRQTPTSVDYIERELATRSDTEVVPPGYAAAVIHALRKGKIGPNRALELLHGTVLERDLPAEKQLALESMTAELEILPD